MIKAFKNWFLGKSKKERAAIIATLVLAGFLLVILLCTIFYTLFGGIGLLIFLGSIFVWGFAFVLYVDGY